MVLLAFFLCSYCLSSGGGLAGNIAGSIGFFLGLFGLGVWLFEND